MSSLLIGVNVEKINAKYFCFAWNVI